MNANLERIFTDFLAGAGALAPARLGDAGPEAPKREAVDRFLDSVAACEASTQRVATGMLLVYCLILVGVVVALYLALSTHANAMLATVLGGTGVAGLTVIPVRMQALWKDVTLMRLTMAALPGRTPQDQLDLIKLLHVAGKSAAGT